MHKDDRIKESGPVFRCVVCVGPLEVKRRHHQAIEDPHGAFGPGYRPLACAWTENDGFTCPRCGLHYDKAPN